MKHFKIDVFLKKVSGIYLVKYFWLKNGVFGDLYAKKSVKPSVFSPFTFILGGLEGFFDF
jgi:hypothetical protein